MITKLDQRTQTRITFFLKLLVLGSISALLYFKLRDQQNIFNEMVLLIDSTFRKNWPIFLIVIALMPVNWLLESLKWKLLSQRIINLTLPKALKGVLAGLTLGFVTPHGLGDYIGRIVSIDHKNRMNLIGALLLGRVSQMVPTILFGLYGLTFLFDFKIVMLTISLSLIVALLVYVLVKTMKKWKVPHRYLDIITEYSLKQIFIIQLLSLLRYMTFTFQFIILINVFIPKLDFWINFGGITWIFLAKSILPTFNFLSDLGVREYSAVYFFESFNVNVAAVVCASLSIWIINILIPTLIGLPFILKLKWIKK
jgi:hypothetical protein